MGQADWTDLERLGNKIADAQSRLRRARSTQNHGIAKALEQDIAAAEKLRDEIVSQIVAQLMDCPDDTSPGLQISTDHATTLDDAEGVDPMWSQLSRADLQRVKRDLDARRAEMLARHAEELKAIDSETAEIDTLEQAIDNIVSKFSIGSAEVLSLERPDLRQAG